MACDGLSPNITCNESLTVKGDSNPATSILMFLAGVVGNLLALFILGVHRKEHRSRSSVFSILVTGLALTDLLGTCLLSPSVFICYARNVSLIGLGDESLCQLFGFAMSFFGLAPTLILCAMAVERCLAISHPYFYSVHIRQSFAKVTLLAVYLFSLAFCLLPFVGIGKFRQYCPGTWCFIDMDATGDADAERVQAFSLTYSSLMALIILAVFACNGSVIASLCQMHRSHLIRRGSACSAGRKRKLSLALFGWGEEEMDHLVLLALITVIFAVCSLPLTIAGFINAIHPFCGDNENLAAFRFYAFNPIVDPWVFIICRKSVLQHLRSLLSCRFGQGAGVKTPAHCPSVPLPLESHVIQYKPPEGTESSFYSGVPSSPTT
ncbi:prostacyclin receptor isoform X1 [Syngnathus typhle]|uniref:prostacyclin receptor isoform X1 n=1 Tax=Syngnathus typhle TaxID=161592 RepID=UPI002A6A7643|nr:prostacyclin receptor isoform X1 [Syngnathus typhle]XP_061136182.1 prostacyclin receptor isoform X1 [Syngnathus typhle]